MIKFSCSFIGLRRKKTLGITDATDNMCSKYLKTDMIVSSQKWQWKVNIGSKFITQWLFLYIYFFSFLLLIFSTLCFEHIVVFFAWLLKWPSFSFLLKYRKCKMLQNAQKSGCIWSIKCIENGKKKQHFYEFKLNFYACVSIKKRRSKIVLRFLTTYTNKNIHDTVNKKTENERDQQSFSTQIETKKCVHIHTYTYIEL